MTQAERNASSAIVDGLASDWKSAKSRATGIQRFGKKFADSELSTVNSVQQFGNSLTPQRRRSTLTSEFLQKREEINVVRHPTPSPSASKNAGSKAPRTRESCGPKTSTAHLRSGEYFRWNPDISDVSELTTATTTTTRRRLSISSVVDVARSPVVEETCSRSSSTEFPSADELDDELSWQRNGFLDDGSGDISETEGAMASEDYGNVNLVNVYFNQTIV